MAELSRLGRYQLKRVLGRGAMGVVYEGLDPSLNRRVAVKTILRNAAIDEETAQHYSAQFSREAQAAGRLNHPNIVQVFDFAVEGEVAYLVMEFIQGRELRSFFEAKEAFAAEEAVRIMGELLDALDFAHEAGVIHRDVKPANVMLDAQRKVKLADFGVARIQDSDRSAAGTMVGTPAFMSPEQIQGLKIDRRTDIFSAGTILYQLLTGEQPFTGQGAWTVAKKIMQEEPPQPSSVVKSISPVFDGIVSKALAKSAPLRYANAREFAAALRGALAEGTMPGVQAAPAAPAARAEVKASETELEFWRAIQNSTDAAEFEFYLEQFPEGTYARLARHKIAKLTEPAEAARKAAEEKERQEAEERAAREAEEQARREAEAKQQAEEKARVEAADKARREAAERANWQAVEKAKREAEEKLRKAQALARLKQLEEATEKAKAKAAVDEDATVAMRPARREPPAAAAAKPPPAAPRSLAVPAGIVTVILAGAIGAYLFAGRAPAPAPVAEPAPVKVAPAPAVDADKIRRETEERLRREFAEKATAERAAQEKALAEKAATEKAAASKAAAARLAEDKAATQKAAIDKANAERAAAEKAAAEKAAAEKAAAEKTAVEKAAVDKLAAEKAAAAKVAATKAAAETAELDRQVAESKAIDAGIAARLERFKERKGRSNFFPHGSAIGMLPTDEIVYVTDGMCPRGEIKEVTGGDRRRNTPRRFRCIPIPD